MISDNVDLLLKNPVSFLDNSNPTGEVAISCRIRLARNISDTNFPSSASDSESIDICEEISAAALETAAFAHQQALNFTIAEMSKLDRAVLLERRLASKEFFKKLPGRRLLVCPQEACSLMINEEDQLRLQVIRPGMQLRQVWKEINQLDDTLAQNLKYAFDDQLGFLTSCPTNVGTGMRASVMGTISVMIGAGMFIGQILFIVLQNFLPMDVLFLLICLPFMALSLLVLLTKVKETKDVDLDNITADTYR
jgi:protein arginine kinase